MALTLSAIAGEISICRLEGGAPIPAWALEPMELVSITRAGGELSIVCASDRVPDEVRASSGWRGLRVEGPLDFALTGIMASIAEPLARAGISIFVINTYDTDYVFVRDETWHRAIEALEAAGHVVRR